MDEYRVQAKKKKSGRHRIGDIFTIFLHENDMKIIANQVSDYQKIVM